MRSAPPVHHMLRVKPAKDGAVVHIPERKMRPLKAEGELVPGNDYWHRRLAMGDVVEVKQDAPAAAEAAVPDPAPEAAPRGRR